MPGSRQIDCHTSYEPFALSTADTSQPIRAILWRRVIALHRRAGRLEEAGDIAAREWLPRESHWHDVAIGGSA